MQNLRAFRNTVVDGKGEKVHRSSMILLPVGENTAISHFAKDILAHLPPAGKIAFRDKIWFYAKLIQLYAKLTPSFLFLRYCVIAGKSKCKKKKKTTLHINIWEYHKSKHRKRCHNAASLRYPWLKTKNQTSKCSWMKRARWRGQREGRKVNMRQTRSTGF